MDDRELLELAAKAAGYVLDSDCERIDIRQSSGAPMPWNPLNDDGDALRLAVKLQICLTIEFDRVIASSELDESDSFFTEFFYKLPEPTDRNAATRRAIVRAAAEIGRAM